MDQFKHFLKVNSQAGATLVAAVLALAVMRGWVDWTENDIAGALAIYAALMIVLRQQFSLTNP